MFKWDTNNIINITGGKKIGIFHYTNLGISTDTRNIKKGDIFIALKGKNFNGHNFLHEAFLNGAVVALISEYNNKYGNVPIILVKDTLKALHNIASYYINNILIKTKIIAITGSIGKTTTKDMLYTVLSKYGVCHANKGNLNNNIGLPLTILNSPENSQYLILEMGMSKSYEIKELSKISSPDIAVITNIEPVHLQNFSSILDIAKAKLEVLYGMKNNGTLILNKDDKYYYYLSLCNKNIISFGKHKDADICLYKIIKDCCKLNLKIKIRNNNNLIINFSLSLQYEHFAYSVLAVVSVIKDLGLDLSKLPSILKNFTVNKGRGNFYKIKFNKKYIYLIDDSYNANPTSMKAAIKNLGTFSNYRKVALLGDMLELGSKSTIFHTDLFSSIIRYDINKVCTVGEFMLELHKILPKNIKGKHFNNSNNLLNYLDKIIQDNDVILIKGSNKMKMNIIVEELINI